MTSPQDRGASWIQLAALPPDEQIAAMQTRMLELAAEPAEAHARAAEQMVRAEATLDDGARLEMTVSRFRAWLGMPADAIQSISASIDAARGLLDAAPALRSTGADQTAARELSSTEAARLLELAPSFERALPQEMRAAIDALARRERGADRDAAAATRTARDAAAATRTAPRPFWQFWRR